MSLFSCPTPSVLPVVANQNCLASYGNVIGLGVQLTQSSAPFTDSTTPATDITKLAAWTTLISDATAKGIKILPVTNFVSAAGEAITSGGNDQTTFMGLPKLIAGGYMSYTGTLEGYTPALADTAKSFTQFSRVAGGRSILTIYQFTDENYIIAKTFEGLKVYGWFVSDVIRGDTYKGEDNYNLSFYAPYGASHKLVYYKADFDVSALKNA